MAKKTNSKTTKVLLPIAIFNILWFTIAAIILQFVTSVELSSTLIISWYGFWTSEIFILAGIKISKIKKENDSDGVAG